MDRELRCEQLDVVICLLLIQFRRRTPTISSEMRSSTSLRYHRRSVAQIFEVFSFSSCWFALFVLCSVFRVRIRPEFITPIPPLSVMLRISKLKLAASFANEFLVLMHDDHKLFARVLTFLSIGNETKDPF